MPKKKGKRNSPLGMKVRETRRHMIAHSPELKQDVRAKKGLLMRTYRMIECHFEEMRKGGAEIVDAEHGISIRKAGTGHWEGKHQLLTLRVSVPGKQFFVKVYPRQEYVNVLRGFRRVEAYLKKRKYEIGGVNFRIIKPHLLYENKATNRSYIATDFFGKGEVLMVYGMQKGEKQKQINSAIESLGRVMDWKYDVIEIIPQNAFYHPKTDTVLLFDLQEVKP